MIELFLVKPNYMLEIPTQRVIWSGQRYQAARKIEASIFYDTTGYHVRQEVIEGDTLLFKWNGAELFRGTVFDRGLNKSGMLTLTAYDMLQYFLLNKDVYAFLKKRLDEILLKICKDYEVPHSGFPNTKYVIPSLPMDTETPLYDIILRAMIKTHKESKKKFHLYSRLGKVHLSELKTADIQWVLETGANIIDYNYTTSITETATKVKMVSGDGKATAVVTDETGKKQFGILQHYEKASETLTETALKEKANKQLTEKKGVKTKLDVDALGITDVTSGAAIYALIDDIRMKKTMFVDSDVHTFEGELHTMSLNLIETNVFPDIEEPVAAVSIGTDGTTGSTGSTSGSSTATGKAKTVMDEASKYINRLKYSYGGKNIAGGSGDCSGFTKFIFAKVGVNIGDGTMTQIKKGRQVSASDAQAGDLVFFKGIIEERGPDAVSHVGIVTRPGYCISLAGSGCKEHGYTLQTHPSYWGKHYMQIRRVL